MKSGIKVLQTDLFRTLIGMGYNTPAFRGRSANFATAMKRSAERRQCPKCNRKSAMVRIPPEDRYDEWVPVAYCRWCGYERATRGDTGT